jgi:hypothetical protein
MRTIMERLKLTVNEEKTHLCEMPRERFDFLVLGFEINPTLAAIQKPTQ